jgi:nucleotide-binding universal stress UspA family protein
MVQRILVPLDGSGPSQRGLHEAVALARALGAQLVLLHVIDDFPQVLELAPAAAYREALQRLRQRGEALLSEARERAAAAGVAAETLLCEIGAQTVGDAIVQQVQASRCDLVAMGTHGRRGLQRLALGSDAEVVLRTSPVPVLLVRPGAADA